MGGLSLTSSTNVTEPVCICTRAWNEGYPKVPEDFTITKKAPTRNLKALVGAFNQKVIVGAFSVIVKSSRTFA